MTYLVVDVAVGEHCVEVLYALTCTTVEVIFQAFLNGPHVHGLFDNFMVILGEKNAFFLINNFLIYGSTEIPIPLVYLLKCGHLFHNGPKMLKIGFKKTPKNLRYNHLLTNQKGSFIIAIK